MKLLGPATTCSGRNVPQESDRLARRSAALPFFAFTTRGVLDPGLDVLTPALAGHMVRRRNRGQVPSRDALSTSAIGWTDRAGVLQSTRPPRVAVRRSGPTGGSEDVGGVSPSTPRSGN